MEFINTKFLLGSWIINIFYTFMDLMPPFIRNLTFKIILRKCGKNVMIDYGVFIRYPWLVEIGHNVSINRNCSVYPSSILLLINFSAFVDEDLFFLLFLP